MDWVLLLLAGIFETVFTFSLEKIRRTKSRIRLFWTGAFVLSMILSMWFLTMATRTLPIGTAYPVWTGIGAVGTVFLGILYFQERLSLRKSLYISLLIISIVGLKIV